MKHNLSIYRKLPRFNSNKPSAVTIGNFDGVHLGHQAILARLNNAALQHNLVPSVLTFQPHPRTYFALKNNLPEQAPTQISLLRDKVHFLAQHYIKQIVLLDFNHALASMEAADFIQNLLVKGLNTKWIIVGEDFRYGNRRKGDLQLLREAGERFGFKVETIDDIIQTNQTVKISSSSLRTALAEADLQQAAQLLGHNYQISGHVTHGQKIGRTIGFPTLNINVPANCALRHGIYVVRVHMNGHVYKGAASIGVRPSVQSNGRVLLEVHILEAQPEAYGKLACIEFLSFLRNEIKFPDLTTLTTAIQHDVQCTYDYFATYGL